MVTLQVRKKKNPQLYSIHRPIIENAFTAAYNFWKGNVIKFKNKLLVGDIKKKILVKFLLLI